MTFSATTVPILGMYNSGGAFPTPGPSAWASGPTTNMTAGYFAFPLADWATYIGPFVARCKANSLTPFIELEPWNFDQTPVPFSSITSGAYDSQLLAIGSGIAAAAVPVMVTWAHEFNVSGQYPWSQGATESSPPLTGSGPGGADVTPAQWVSCWKYVHDKINSTAAGYAIWVWACSAFTGGTTISPAGYFPGSSYLDICAIDGYPDTRYGSSLGTFSGQFGPTMTIIRNTLGWSGPVFISETNLAQMVASGGESITNFVADMHASNVSGIFEFQESYEPDMTSAQWTEYNNAVAARYGGGGGTGAYSYTQTLIDGFTGSSLNPALWVEPLNTNGISVSGGTLKIQGLTNYEQVVVETTPFTHNLANGIFGLQLSQSGTADPGTMWFLGIADNYVSAGGNAYEFQTFPANGSGSWYSWAFSGTNVGGDTGNQNILSPSVWRNGDWLGIGNFNINGSNDVHVYKSGDGQTWTEIASWTVTGAVNESAAGFYFGTNYNPGAGPSTYLATIDNVSWFTRGAPSGGGGAVTFGLVQETSGSTAGESLTLTFPAPVTSGNAVILVIAGYYNGTVTGITAGGAAASFTHVTGAGGTGATNAAVFYATNLAGGSPSLAVTTSATGIIAWAYEVAGSLVTYDRGAGAAGTGTALSSGATAATVPYQHFVVGAAVVVGSAATVTGPSSGGWTNVAAYHGVASAHAAGGVCGYQQPSSPGTYAYTATASASARWGAVTAAFLAAPNSSNAWGGVLFNEHASTGYTGITCTFTIPSSVPVASSTLCSIWVGLGNVQQTGIYLSGSTGYTGNVNTSPWSWWFAGGGGAGELWSASAYPTAAGHSLTLTLTCDNRFYYATIANNTLGWSYTEVKSILAVNLNSWSTNSTTGLQTTAGWIWPVPQAEIVIEQELPNALPDYGTITFTNISTVPAATVVPVRLFGNPGPAAGIAEYPGEYDLTSGEVVMYWNQAN